MSLCNINFFNFQKKLWKIGITICEDIWVEQNLQNEKILGKDPLKSLENEKLDLLINLSASPFIESKSLIRQRIAAKAASHASFMPGDLCQSSRRE